MASCRLRLIIYVLVSCATFKSIVSFNGLYVGCRINVLLKKTIMLSVIVNFKLIVQTFNTNVKVVFLHVFSSAGADQRHSLVSKKHIVFQR